MRSRVSLRSPLTRAGRAGSAGAGDGAGFAAGAGVVAFNTSCFVTREPEGSTLSSFTSCAFATFLAVGVDFLSDVFSAAAGAALASAAGLAGAAWPVPVA